MYTQNDITALYVNNALAYQQALKLERIKNLFAIVGSIFTIAAAIYLMVKDKK